MTPVHDRNANSPTGASGGGGQPDVRTRATEALDGARERSREIYDTARERVANAYDSSKKEIDANPAAFLIGGVAIGALLAALIPRTQREVELLGDFGRKLNDKAKDAARSARTAGIAKIDDLGMIPEAARSKVKELAGESGPGQD